MMMPSNFDFEAAQPLEIYIFCDGPLFYSATVGQYIFVFLAVADDLWICKELTTVETLIEFERGLFDGRDLFLDKQGRMFLWKNSKENSLKTSIIEIDHEDVSENKWHVPAGSFFKIRKS